MPVQKPIDKTGVLENRRVLEKTANSNPDANSSEKMINFEVLSNRYGKSVQTDAEYRRTDRNHAVQARPSIADCLMRNTGAHNKDDRARTDEDRGGPMERPGLFPIMGSPAGQKRTLAKSTGKPGKAPKHTRPQSTPAQGKEDFRARTEKRLGQLLFDDPAAPSFQA